MWYEILPSMFIVGGCVMIPQYIIYYMNNAVFGNPMRRNLNNFWDGLMFARDARLTGRPWKLAGLENIPDE